MRIEQAAEDAGVPTQTIRFYERRDLLPQPRRGLNGYREYDASILTRLAFIRSGQAAGFTLVEVASILDLRPERSHNPEVAGSNPAPATNFRLGIYGFRA